MRTDETQPLRVVAPSLHAGELLLGKYKVDGFIASVDGWEVYEATGDRKVLIRVARMRRVDPYRSFLLDARQLIQLRHANIVPMIAEDLIKDHVVVVSEVVAGESLITMIQREGAVPWPQAVKLGVGILAGLEALHDVGVFHRALTARSVIASGGRAPLARIWDTALGHVHPEGASSSSHASPEHDLGDRSRALSDVYAAGLILYRMLAGSPPFGDAGLAAVRRRFTERIPPPAPPAHRPPLPRPIVDAVLASLAIDPGERPRSAREFADALRPFL